MTRLRQVFILFEICFALNCFCPTARRASSLKRIGLQVKSFWLDRCMYVRKCHIFYAVRAYVRSETATIGLRVKLFLLNANEQRTRKK